MSVQKQFDASQCLTCRNAKLQIKPEAQTFVCTAFGENTPVNPKQAEAAKQFRGAVFKEEHPIDRIVIAGAKKGQPTQDPFPASEDVLALGDCERHDFTQRRVPMFISQLRVARSLVAATK